MKSTENRKLKALKKAARDGDVQSQYDLVKHYLNLGTESGYREAIPWLRRAAKHGEAWAQYSLGYSYDEGKGVTLNRRWATFWYEKAAKQGYDSAQLNLGIILANSRGSAKDLPRAVKLYRAAARQGNRNAQGNLGLYYSEGRGVPQNRRVAFKWYLRAAEQGDADAQLSVGYCFHEGEGVRRNYEESVRWYRRAARGGHMDAFHNLGLCYLYGDGVRQSKALANRWFKKAADLGDKISKMLAGAPNAIILGIGIEGLKFGATRGVVREELGEPDAIKQIDYLRDGSAVDEIWDYYSLRLEVTFDEDDDFKLSSLETTSNNFMLEGEDLIGRNKKDVLVFAKSHDWGEPEDDEILEGTTMVLFDKLNLSFLFDHDVLEHIEWGYFWLDENTPKWPD